MLLPRRDPGTRELPQPLANKCLNSILRVIGRAILGGGDVQGAGGDSRLDSGNFAQRISVVLRAAAEL